MTNPFYDVLSDQVVGADVVPVEIRSVGEPAISARATPEPPGGYPRPYATEQLNARMAVPLPLGEGLWEVRWKTALTGGLQPNFTLQVNRRIVVQGAFQWQLFDVQGTSIEVGALGVGEIVLDSTNGLFYGPDPSGVITAHRLDDGGHAFSVLTFVDERYRQALLARRDNRLMAVSVEFKVEPHGGHLPDESIVEVYDLGMSMTVNEVGVLTEARVQARLSREAALLYAALNDDVLVLATEDRLYLADWDLQVQEVLHGTFIPLAMSLDESGRLYLIVHVPGEADEGYKALWVVTPDGERIVAVTLPEQGAYTPPIVGYDHRVYILLENRVLALSPEGEVLWTTGIGNTIAGAVVTADDRLLVTAGSVLFAIDAEGERQGLFMLDGDRWTTPPVLTDRQRVLAASEQYLYCLQLQP